MNKFWQFARQMLRYKRLLGLAGVGAVFDALCAIGGFTALIWIIQQLFESDRTARDIVAEKLAGAPAWMGDLSAAARYVPDEQWAGFAFLLGVIFVVALLGSAGRFMHQYFAITVSLRTVLAIRRRGYHRLLHLSMGVAADGSTADKLARVVRDCGQLSKGFSALTSKAVRDVLQGAAALTVATALNWQLTGIFILSVPVIGLLIRKFGKVIRRAMKRANRQFGHMLGALSESLQSLAVVKVHQAEGYERRRFNRINRRVLAEEMSARTARALASPTIEVIALAGVMAVALAASWLIYRSGTAAPPELVGVLAMLGIAGASFKPLANLNNDLHEAAAAAERIDQIIHLPREASRKGNRLARHRRTVEFENVTFTYPASHRPAIADVNLRVEQGSVCAIVGGNGSGKSTLVNLLPRLYEPTEGRVLIDGVDIAACSLRSVRDQIALVTQQTVLFEGTVADNIAYGRRHVARQQVIAAARRAHAHEFIDELPDGYDAAIGEWGSRLSGGQRQRIAIARAILRDPAILILDEATSQIDSESEAKINQALGEFMADRTTFVIAHRLSTVVGADMIVVMEDGRIASRGTHTELMETSDAYRVLCRTQLQVGRPQAAAVTRG